MYNHIMREKEDKKTNSKNCRLLIWLLPGPLMYGLYRLAFLFPQSVETLYSRGIFRVTNQALSFVTGALAFSFGEFMLYAFSLFVIVYMVALIIKSIKAKKLWWVLLLRRLVILVCVCSMLYALFIGLWAFNYARMPLGASLGLDTSAARTDELYGTCEALVNEAIALREQTDTNAQGIFDLDKEAAMLDTAKYYDMASEASGYAFLGGRFSRAKPILFSDGLSQTQITGIYCPFSAEANVNANAPDLYFAATTLHEAAHQRGFAREDESNFLAYYVGSYSEDTATQYSSVMLALVHAMNKLLEQDEQLYIELREKYTQGMNDDLQSNREYWEAYEGKTAQVSEQVNNAYLKSNLQADGVKSYGRMVDLLIGLWRSGELK